MPQTHSDQAENRANETTHDIYAFITGGTRTRK